MRRLSSPELSEAVITEPITGGCLCGEVRYLCTGEPLTMGVCQCERCQRQSGSAFLIATVFNREQVNFEGRELQVFAAGERGHQLYRHFCPTCGSAVMITLDRYPEIRSIMGGTWDNKARLRPTFSLWTSNGQPWLSLPPSIILHAGYPDGVVG